MQTIEELKKAYQNLLNEWSSARKEYDTKDGFTWDGPSDWENYFAQKPRILFVTKEAHSEYNPDTPIDKINGAFHLNLARWKYAIKSLYDNPNKSLEFLEDSELRKYSNNNNDDIALVEIKKFNENNKKSSDDHILEFAKRDKDFLKRQIDLISPQVVVCCSTIDSYDVIYEDSRQDELLSDINKKVQCWRQDNNRLIVDFYHPSHTRYPGGPKALFELLCKVLDKGLVFENFDWGRK